MSDDLALWQKTTEYLRGVLNSDVFSRWIEPINPSAIKNNCLILNVDNDFYQDWLEKNYKGFILDALKVVGAPMDLTVTFEVSTPNPGAEPHPKAEEPRPAPPKKSHPKANHILANSLNSTFTFENFVTGQSNSFTHAIAMAVSQAPGQAYNPLFIYGQTGIGKTHLMQAIGHRILQTTEKSVCYVSCETFFNEYIEALWKTKGKGDTSATARTADFRNRYRRVDVLLVDDIQFLCGKDSTQTEFFHTFNELFNLRKQIIMTSDLPPKSLKGLEPRLVSRFEWGMVTEIECPDFETRLAILRYKNSLAKIQLNDDALTFIAYNIKSNVRNLEGALTRSVAYAALNRVDITTEVLQDLLKDQLSSERQKDLTCAEIQKAVADYFDLRLTDMTSDTRTREIVEPRMIAMFLCHKLTSLSLPAIANSFKRTHATILHASKTIQARMQVDKNLSDAVKKITVLLGRNPSEVTP